MYKSANKYEQGRTVRAATEQTRNDHLDASAFRDGERAEYDRLTAEKRGLETDISELKARITRAKALAWEKKIYTHVKTYQRWEFERIEKTRKINAIESSLAELKRQMKAVAQQEDWGRDQYFDYHKAFHEMAKTLLADAVYERVRIAALHTLSEPRAGQ